MKHGNRLLLLVILLSLCGCATTAGRWSGDWWVRDLAMAGPGPAAKMTLRYRTGPPGEEWVTQQASPGDYAFYNQRYGATIYTDTSCGKKYKDAPLTILSNHLTMGFEDVEVTEQSTGMLSDRASLERIATGNLDGVPVRLASTVVKKGPCVFDLVLVSNPGQFEAALADYRVVRDGFDARFDP